MGHLWWSDGLYSFSALVPLVSLGIVYAKRKRLRSLEVQPVYTGLAVVIAAAAATVAADWFDVLHSLTPLLVVAMLCGITLTLWGVAILKELLFPISFLLMLVPIPPALVQAIDLPLQIMCAKIIENMSRVAGVAVQRTGSMIVFPGSDSINVAPACNGVRSAITMLMLSIIYVYLSRGRWYSKLAVLISAVPIAYFANLVRLFGIVSGVHYLGERFIRYEQVFDYAFGLVVFSACVGMLVLWARVVKCRMFIASY